MLQTNYERCHCDVFFFVSKFPIPHSFQIDILKKICFEVGFVVRGIFSNNSKSQLRCLFPRSRTGLHCSTLDLWPSDLYLCIHILRLSWSNLEVEFEISCQLYWSKLEREWEITNKGFLDYGYLLQEFFSIKAAMHLSRTYSSLSTISFSVSGCF